VRLIPREGGRARDVTRDRAFERDPAWSPDGRYLLFSSDRTGIFNVYAFRVEDRTLWRVTNVVLGAFEPEVSPDGTQLALVTYGALGYDLSRMPFDAARFVPVSEVPVEALQRPPPAPLPPEEIYPVRPYGPLQTLRPP